MLTYILSVFMITITLVILKYYAKLKKLDQINYLLKMQTELFSLIKNEKDPLFFQKYRHYLMVSSTISVSIEELYEAPDYLFIFSKKLLKKKILKILYINYFKTYSIDDFIKDLELYKGYSKERQENKVFMLIGALSN